MPGIETDTLAATCGDIQVNGAPSVFAEGLSVSKVGVSLAGPGVIIGPGSQSVFAEGIFVSLPGDVVQPHPPCPLPAIHCAALTNPAGNGTVFAGTGMVGGGGSVSDTVEQLGADLKVTSFVVTPTELLADTPAPPATPWCSTLTPVVFTWTVTNVGQIAADAFTIGLWRTPFQAGAGPFLLTREGGALIPNSQLFFEQAVGSLAPGASKQGTTTLIALPAWCKQAPDTWWSVFADIDQEVTEANEQNWVEAISISVV